MSHRALVALALMLAGCAQSPTLYVSVDRRTIDGRVERAVLIARAADAWGQPGQGTVRLTTAAGSFVEGDEVPLVEGVATGTFQCDPRVEATCSGEVPISAEWTSLSERTSVRVGPQVNTRPLRWRLLPTGTVADLADVAVSGAGTIWVVGAAGTVLRHDGVQWNAHQLPAEFLTANVTSVWAGDTVLVAGEGGAFARWDGQVLVKAADAPRTEVGTPEDFTAVWGRAGADAWAVTAQGGVFHFDGVALTQELRVAARLTAVGGTSSEVWVAGEGVVLRLTDSGWSEVPMPMLGAWRAVSVDLDGVWIAGERRDGFSDNPGVCLVGTGDFLASMTAIEPITDVYLSGTEDRFTLSASDVYRKAQSGSWTSTNAPIGGRAIAGRSAVDVVVAGDDGVVFRGTR